MKAMVFAAGIGSRLRPITDTVPKALVPVAGRPMLGRIIDRLNAAGISDITVNVHHHAGKVIDFLEKEYGAGAVNVSDESGMLLDTGGGVLAARRFIEGTEPIMLYNADILSDFPIEEMIEAHKDGKADVTLLVSPRDSSRRLLFDKSRRMCGWENISTGEIKPKGLAVDDSIEALAFGGVHIINPLLFDSLEQYGGDHGAVFSLVPFYIEYSQQLRINGFIPSESYSWFDIGSVEKLAVARRWAASHLE